MRELGWLNKPKNTVLAKIIWSMEACRMLHPSAHTDDQSPPEGQADMALDGDDQGDECYSEHSAGIEVGTARGRIAVEARDCWLESLEPDREEEEWQ